MAFSVTCVIVTDPVLKCMLGSMLGENWRLVTGELVEIEKQPVEAGDFGLRITHHFRGIYRIHLK